MEHTVSLKIVREVNTPSYLTSNNKVPFYLVSRHSDSFSNNLADEVSIKVLKMKFVGIETTLCTLMLEILGIFRKIYI